MSRPNTTGRGRTAPDANGTGGTPPEPDLGIDKPQSLTLEDATLLGLQLIAEQESGTWALANLARKYGGELAGERVRHGVKKRLTQWRDSMTAAAPDHGVDPERIPSVSTLGSYRYAAISVPGEHREGMSVLAAAELYKLEKSLDKRIALLKSIRGKGLHPSVTNIRREVGKPTYKEARESRQLAQQILAVDLDAIGFVVGLLATEAPDVFKEFMKQGVVTADADVLQEFVRTALERSAEKDEEDSDNEDSTDTGSDDSEDEEEQDSEDEDEEEQDNEEDGSDEDGEDEGSTGSGSSTSKKSAAAKKAAKTRAAKSKAKANTYNNATDAEKKTLARIEWSANLSKAIGRASKGAFYACQLLEFIGERNNDLWLQEWEVNWLERKADDAKEELDRFLTLLLGVQRLPNVSDDEVADGIEALEKMLEGLS